MDDYVAKPVLMRLVGRLEGNYRYKKPLSKRVRCRNDC